MVERETQREHRINQHYMDVLRGAIAEAGLTRKEVEEIAGYAPGSLVRWLANKQIMRAPVFTVIAVAIGADVAELTARAMAKIKAAGVLDEFPAGR